MMSTTIASAPLIDLTLKIGSGATPRGGERSYSDAGIPLIRSMNVYDLRFEREGLAFIDHEQARALDHVDVRAGDVLINITGASVARCCVAPTELAGARVNQHVAIIRPRSDRLDSRFLSYCLVAPDTKTLLLSLSRVGGTREALTKGGLERFRVPVPALGVQRRIASILGAYDDLIEVNRRRIAALEEVARRLFEEWFVHYRFPGHGGAAPAVDTTRLPEGWRQERLGDVAAVNGDTLKPATAPKQIGYVDIASVSPGTIEKVEWMAFEAAPGRARRRVKDGSIVWSTVRPNRRSFALVLDPDPNTIVSTGFAVLDARTVPFPYLYHWVTRDEFVAFLTANATGAAYPAVTSAVFERAMVAVPPGELLSRFVRVVEPMLRLAARLRKGDARLAASRELLLPRLISGELPVGVVDRELKAIA